MNKRSKGLAMVRQVKKILEDSGHIVEGPGYKPIFAKGKMCAVHKDFFGCFDLLSCKDGGRIIGHQVTDMVDKSSHAKKIFQSGWNGDLWCYEPRQGFSRFWVHNDNGELRIELLEEKIKPNKEVKP